MPQLAPPRSASEARANATFEAVLWAFARPGQIRQLPAPGEAPLIEALIDRECRVYSADPLLLPQIMRSGAEITGPERADHLFLGALADSAALRAAATGSDLYPDEGATLVVRARLQGGAPLRLTGPGVEGALTLALDGLPAGFWQTRAALIRYPMGVELIVIDGDRILCLPRSTNVEVL